MPYDKNKPEVEWVFILWNLKYMGKLVIKLKAIKYKEDFFSYLSSYSNLGFQATCFQILSFRLHVFKPFFSSSIYLRLLRKYICPSLGS